MNQELQKKLVELLDLAEKSGKEAFLFGKEQVPDIIHQMLVFNLVESAVVGMICIALIYPVVENFKQAKIVSDNDKNDYSMEPIFRVTLGGVAAVFVASRLFCSIDTILKISMAPKLYILEQLKGMIK